MKLTTIVASALVSMLAFVATTQAKEIAVNGTDFQALTNAKQACLERNDKGWVWYNYSAGTCASMTVVSSAIHINDGTTGDMLCYVDGSCPSGQTATCTLKTIAYTNGEQTGSSDSETSAAGSTFDMSLYQPRSDIGDYNYSVITCNLGAGCRLWGYGCNYP